jgi:hypothetical protein
VLSETDKDFCPECGAFYDRIVDEWGRGDTQVAASDARGSASTTPWKLIIGAGVAVVFIVVAFVMLRSEDPAYSGVDGVLQVGSCADIEGAFAVEIDCGDARSGRNHWRVESVIAMDEECESAIISYPDRLGMGRICLIPLSD